MSRCIDAVHYISIVTPISDRQRCIRQGPIAKRSRVRCTKSISRNRVIRNDTNRVIQGVYRVGIIDPFAYMCLTEHE